MVKTLFLVFVAFCVCEVKSQGPYAANWTSLDTRPLPAWYDQSKFGIFIHWGVFSVPSYSSEWYWWDLDGAKDPDVIAFHDRVYGPNFSYQDFAPMFTCELFDPEDWASVLQQSGAKYVVLTTKHHEGFTLYPSSASWNWNAVDTGPHMDLVAALAPAVRAQGLVFGTYHSLFEWFNPLYLADKAGGFDTQVYVQDVLMPELMTLVNNYQPEVIWADGDWEANSTYWNSTEFLAWLFNESPVKDTVVVNDRWGTDAECQHGSYWTCQDHYQPGKLVNHKWENCMTMQMNSWGYDRMITDLFYDVPELLLQLVSTVAFGGNLLLNIGPTHDGRILEGFRSRLLEMGAWLSVNGEAIYATSPWPVAQNETASQVYYTMTGDAVYAIAMAWPENNTLTLQFPSTTPATSVSMLGGPANLTWESRGAEGIAILVPALTPATVPCQYAWVFKMEGLSNH